MDDPFPIPPPAFLKDLVTPIAKALNLTTLPLHIHEIVLATVSYHLICSVLAPALSTYFFPTIYPSLPRRTRLNWDVHVVSMVQSIIINMLALWVIWVDEERGRMSWEERIWGYDGAGGMIQAFAAGYFVWDLLICIRWVSVFGLGMLAHAVAALVVFSLGFVSGLMLCAPLPSLSLSHLLPSPSVSLLGFDHRGLKAICGPFFVKKTRAKKLQDRYNHP